MCTSPLRAFYTGSKTEKGGDLLAISKGFAGLEEVSYTSALRASRDYFPVNLDFMYFDHQGEPWLYKFVDVPCGHCLECQEAKAREWANRCIMEFATSKDCWFVTLTYDPKFYPGTIVKRHFQLFMKRLRKIVGPGVRFFACGEYGAFRRGHYHAVLFDCPLHLSLGSAQEIRHAWPYGFSTVAPVNFNRCAYVARYTNKKLLPFELAPHQEPPFILMSRRPGIGERFLEKAQDTIMLSDRVYLPSSGSVTETVPPRYFYKLLEKQGISLLDYKDAHQVAAVINEISQMSKAGVDREGLLDGRRHLAQERRKRHERVL